MLKTYFKSKCTQAHYYESAAGPYLDDFLHWFEEHGYGHQTIRRRICGAAQFATWAEATGRAIPELDGTALESFGDHLAHRGQLRDSCGDYQVRFLGARHFLRFLQTQGLATPPVATSIQPTPPALWSEFRHWMLTQRGVTESTLNTYRAILLDLLSTLGEQAEQFTAQGLRKFVLQRVRQHNPNSAQNVISAVRMFLRFLITTGRCQPPLEAAIPRVAAWRLSTLPRYLASEEVERVIAACDPDVALGARDRAVILLLARLGLRASEVAKLRLGDIDWLNATLQVRDKCRRQACLPLPQDVGDALWHYLEQVRPPIDHDRVFITLIAPQRPLSRATVTQTAARALRRAGIAAPFFGAHLFRHSVATTLLRQGASLQTIAAVLRHSSVETTRLYAKVDSTLLRDVALPWPEEPAC